MYIIETIFASMDNNKKIPNFNDLTAELYQALINELLTEQEQLKNKNKEFETKSSKWNSQRVLDENDEDKQLLIIQSLSVLEDKLSWFNLFFSGFRIKWKLEFSFYIIMGLSLFTWILVSAPITRQMSSFMIIPIILPLFITLVLRASQFSEVILRRRYLDNHNFFSGKKLKKRSYYKLRVGLVMKELNKHNALYKEKINELIQIFEAEANIPRYTFSAHKAFISIFLLVLGSVLAFVFSYNDKTTLENLWESLSVILALLFLISVFIYSVELMLIRDIFNFWINKRHHAKMVRYLNEIKFLI